MQAIYGISSELQELVQTANLSYQMRGYSTHSLADPAALTVFSNAVSRRVQLYYCHGESTYFSFDKGGLTTDFTGTYYVTLPGETTGKNRELYSVNDINFSHAKLITLATCKSAGEDEISLSSIAGKISSAGAQMVTAWFTNISNRTSLPNWLNNYHDKLATGGTAYEAAEYANSHFYLAPNVKNCVVFHWNLTPLSEDEISSISNTNSNIVLNTQKNILQSTNKNHINISDVENIIKLHDVNFNKNSYEKIESEGLYSYNMNTGICENTESYIDYMLKIGDFITNSGYTVVLDKNNNVKSINDNTIKNISPLANLQNTNSKYTINEEDTQKYLNKARNNIADNITIESETIKFYCDLKNNKKYAYITFTLNDNNKTSEKTYTYEI